VSRVLLTGASGFVGRCTLPALVRAGHEVHALARRSGPALDGVVWHEADLLAGCGVVAEVEPELLVHLAWYAEHGRFWSSPENVRWVECSLALLRAFVTAGGRRAVMAGSCAEYEWSAQLYPEDAPLRPATLYGAAKHGLHVVAAALCERAGVELAWGRLFFLYGPHEQPGRFVPSLVLALLRGDHSLSETKFTSVVQAMNLRPAHAEEIREAFGADAGQAVAALAASSLTGAVNVASGEGLALADLGRRIAALTGRPELLRIGALPQREHDPPSLVANAARIRTVLARWPPTPLEDGLRETVAWWRGRVEGEHQSVGAQPERDS